MAVLAVVCAFTAVKNCSLVLIQLSACKPVWRSICLATVSAAYTSCKVKSKTDAPPIKPNMLCAVLNATKALRLLAPLLPKSKIPVTFKVLTLPLPVEIRNLSPMPTPISVASSVPIKIDSLVTNAWPRTIFSGNGMILKYNSGTMPMTDTERLASPRVNKAEPDIAGDTTFTSGMRATSTATLCHWSMLLKRCKGICKVGDSTTPRSEYNGRTTSLCTNN